MLGIRLEPTALAAQARHRAQEARERAGHDLQRGDVFFAEVHCNLARAEELMAANAERIAGLRARHPPMDTAAQRARHWRAAAVRSREFADVNRSRGLMSLAQFHDAAADWLAFVARVNEEKAAAESDARPVAR